MIKFILGFCLIAGFAPFSFADRTVEGDTSKYAPQVTSTSSENLAKTDICLIKAGDPQSCKGQALLSSDAFEKEALFIVSLKKRASVEHKGQQFATAAQVECTKKCPMATALEPFQRQACINKCFGF